jgi:putative serine protease PepD
MDDNEKAPVMPNGRTVTPTDSYGTDPAPVQHQPVEQPASWWSRPDADAPADSTPYDTPRDPAYDAPTRETAAVGTPAEAPTAPQPAFDAPSPAYVPAGYGAAPAYESAPYGGSFGAVPPPVQDKRRAGGWRRTALTGVAMVAVAIGGGAVGAEYATSDAPSTPAASSSPIAQPVSNGEEVSDQLLAQVAAAVQPSVVSIAVNGSSGSGTGSGVILREDGTILTNNHVVESAAAGGSIQVKFSDGTTADAEILGRDPSTDLAVIKADGVSGLKAATLGSVDDVQVGETVLAIGSPLGLEGSVSSGIVSALHRPVELGASEQQPQDPFSFGQQQQQPTTTALTDAIQTDAAINPGNSGGALVDTEGRVIGINSAIATTSSQAGSIGLGFAIPIDQAAKVAESLIEGEVPKHALLGVQTTDSPDGDGAVIASVSEGSAAAEAGLQAGDRITELGDRQVDDATALATAVRANDPGSQVKVTYVRDGRTSTATVTLGSAS